MNEKWTDKPIEERVKWYKLKLNELYASVAKDGRLTREDREKNQYLLRQIKDKSNTENKIATSARIIDKMVENEKQYYEVISKIHASLPNLNSRQEKWRGGLYDAIDDIEYIYGP